MSDPVSSPAAHGHAPLSPSAAHRWSRCPASIPMSRGYADRSTEAAQEGTAGHALAEAALRWRYDDMMDPTSWVERLTSWDETYGHTYDRTQLAEDVQRFEQNVTRVAGLDPATRSADVLVEVFGETDIPDCWGTSDAVVIDKRNRTVWVMDLKLGRSPVAAAENPQLILYGNAVLKQFDPLGRVFHTVNLCIIQPRVSGVETWSITPRDLMLRTGYLKARAELTQSPEPVFQPSESACRFCRFKQDCSARAKWRVAEMFGTPKAEDVTAIRPGKLSDEALAAYVAEADMIKRWVKDVQEAGAERFPEGSEPPAGFHIEERRRLKVVDADEVKRRLAKAGIEAEETRLKSLTQLRKEVGTKEGLQFLLGPSVAETIVRRLVPDDSE